MQNKRNCSWSLQKRITSLLQKESTSDVELLVGVPPKRFLCHKVILAAGSEVFEAMFFGALQQKSPVRVPDVTSKGFDILLQYLYSDTVSLQDESDAFEAAYVSKKYMVKSLFAICESFLLDNLTLDPENVLETHEEASFLEMAKLQSHCLRYVSRHSRKIFRATSFKKASKNTFRDILMLDLMDIETEVEIIEALWLWGKEQCKESGKQCSVENVRSCTNEFLKYVRFFALKVDEIVDILGKCQILEASEELALLWNMAMPKACGSKRMPPNICTKSKTRSIFNSSKIKIPTEYRYDGNLSTFLIENCQKKLEITVTGSPVTVIGVLVAFKPIPCYSRHDRSLEVEISVTSSSSNLHATAKSRFKAESSNDKDEEQQLLLLDNYVVIEKEQTATLTVKVTGEGVRIMHCTEEEFHRDIEKSKVCFKFDKNEEGDKTLLPIKEVMIV